MCIRDRCECILVAIISHDVERCALCDAEAVGKCLWSNVPQINCITTPLRISAFFGIEDNRYCFFSRLFILCIRQGRSVLAEDMSWTDRSIGYVYVRVTGSAQDVYKRQLLYIAILLLTRVFIQVADFIGFAAQQVMERTALQLSLIHISYSGCICRPVRE